MRFITLLILVSIAVSSVGQDDNIEKQILNFDDSRPVKISRGRNYLLDRFLQDDIGKMKEIKDYLLENAEDENYIALYPAEHYFILYWTQEYEELAESVEMLDLAEMERYNTRIRPPADMLYEKLKIKSAEHAELLESRIQYSELDPETKSFHLLNLKYLLADSESISFFRDTLNAQANQFMDAWPESSYNNFVKNFIRYQLVPRKWGFAFEFFSGYSVYTGALSESFTNNVPFGVAFDISYKKFELYLRDYIGFNKTKKDFGYSSGTWEKGSRAMVFLPEASLGFSIADNNRFKISPFAGVGAMDIAPPTEEVNKNPALKEVSLEFTTTWITGVNIDVKFGPSKVPGWKTSYGFMRLRYAYNTPRYEKKYVGASGNMHYVTVGFGGFSRGLRREL